MALDATVGGTGSNSYITQAAATTYFGGRLDVAVWTAAVSGDKDSALMMACVRLEAEAWQGSRVYVDQRLAWPRNSTYDRDGVLYTSTAIPLILQQAQCELALTMLKSPSRMDDTGLEGFINVKLGSLDVTPRGGTRPDSLPALVKRLLSPVLLTGSGIPVYRA